MDENKWAQKDILELLVKFAGKKGERKVISAQDNAYRQQILIKEHFGLLTVNQQSEVNQLKDEFKWNIRVSFGLYGLITVASMSYFIITKPVIKKLYAEFIISNIIGMGGGYGYYKYHEYQLNESLHFYYLQVIKNLKMQKY